VGVGRHRSEYTTVDSRMGSRAVQSCQRCTITSQYFGSSSITRAWRPAFSQAIRVDPDPPKGSSTMSRVLLDRMAALRGGRSAFLIHCGVNQAYPQGG
jgi:hypothetical protein